MRLFLSHATSILVLTSLLLLSGCKSMPVDNEMKPALLETTSTEQTNLLSGTISKILNGRKISLAKDVFSESNKLILERPTQDPIGMQGMHGRIEGVPKAPTFMLFNKGGICYLVHEKTGQEYPIEGLACKAM